MATSARAAAAAAAAATASSLRPSPTSSLSRRSVSNVRRYVFAAAVRGPYRPPRIIIGSAHRALARKTSASASASASASSATASPPSDRSRSRSQPSAARSSSAAVTLRKLASPFLLLCHPDRTPLVGSALDPSSTSARETNLRAVQTLNGLIDAVEAVYDRAVNPDAAARRRGGKVDLPRSAEIEFLVPSDAGGGASSAPRTGGTTRRPGAKKDSSRTLTRRSVALGFPRELVERSGRVDARGGYDVGAAREVRARMGREVVRLCRAAGCGVPEGYREWTRRNDGAGAGAGPSPGGGGGGEHRRSEGEAGGARWEFGPADLLAEELDLDGSRRDRYADSSPRFSSPSPRGSRRGNFMSVYETSRKKFMDSVDWAAQRKKFDKVWDDAVADVTTRGMVTDSEERRASLIGRILGRVRVDGSSVVGGAGEGREEGRAEASEKKGEGDAAAKGKEAMAGDGAAKQNGEEEASDSKAEGEEAQAHAASPAELESLGLGPVGQLIALRRLSLLLEDNFEDLEMESLGGMWEGLTVVLTPQRHVPDVDIVLPSSSSSSSFPRTAPRPKRRKGTVRESGFKFSYGGPAEDDEAEASSSSSSSSSAGARETAYVPVDFTDEELLREFGNHLGEYWSDQRAADGGFADLFPRHMTH